MNFASLVVLSYKRPDFLRRSLTSLGDKYAGKTPYEIIVVDDGSPENWEYLHQLMRLRLISSVVTNAGCNLGVGASMNRGFSVARGKWIVKLDADLEYRTGWLDAGILILEWFKDVGCVGFFDYNNTTPTLQPRT